MYQICKQSAKTWHNLQGPLLLLGKNYYIRIVFNYTKSHVHHGILFSNWYNVLDWPHTFACQNGNCFLFISINLRFTFWGKISKILVLIITVNYIWKYVWKYASLLLMKDFFFNILTYSTILYILWYSNKP